MGCGEVGLHTDLVLGLDPVDLLECCLVSFSFRSPDVGIVANHA